MNGGLCDALNRGIAEARAPYIARNDQDDLSVTNRLERQMNVMCRHPDAIALFSFNTKIGGKRRWSNADKLAMAPGEIGIYDPLKDGCLLGSTMLASTNALRTIHGFRGAYYPVDDWDLECRLSQAGEVLVLREPLVAYRFQTSANTYRVFSVMQKKTRWTQDSHLRRLKGSPELNFEAFTAQEPTNICLRLQRSRSDLAKLQMRSAGQLYLDGRYIAAASRLTAALLLDPGDLIGRSTRLLRSTIRNAPFVTLSHFCSLRQIEPLRWAQSSMVKTSGR
jgi:glycosyltransferase involved in cell wall biosynthesis